MEGSRKRGPVLLIPLSILVSMISFSSQLPSQNFTPISLSKLLWTTSTQLNSEPETPFIPGTNSIIQGGENDLWIELHSIYRDPSISKSSLASLLRNRFTRDSERTKALSANKYGINSTVYSGFPQGSGEFFTRIGFGSPQQLVQVILDTGSDDIWIQCQPCKHCYNQTDPLFDPAKSHSSSNVLCGSSRCPTTRATCPQNKKRCPYEITYGDGSHSSGDYMTETLTFRGTRVDDILFGCGHDNLGLFAGAAGLFGLGRGETSFMGQAGHRFSDKFSYCLVGLSKPGKSYIMFGPTALSRTAAYTPLISNRHGDHGMFYYVALEGISVGGEPVKIPNGVFDIDDKGEGGVIIDSGTAVTRLAQPAYEAVRDAFRAGTRNLKRVLGDSLFDTCYDFSGLAYVEVPAVVLHFKRADMNLTASNCLVQVDPTQEVFCFAFAGMTGGGATIIGNIQQAGFRVSFDLRENRVGFTPGSCGL